MRQGTLRVLFAAALIAAAIAWPNNWGGRRRSLRQQGSAQVKTSNDADISGEAKYDQRIDHFTPSDARSFPQRYFFNNEFYDGKSNINFLHISGENTDSINTITGSTKPIMDYAKKYGAKLYDLEHRYYGQSRPFKDTAIEDLKFLSSRQAVEDIAEFIKFINKNSAAPSAQKWVVVGGSYAGNLAAWVRLKHPELIVGAVASSAPLLAQLDFYGYLETVDNNVAKIPTCYTQLMKGIQKISDLFESKTGRDTLDAKFPISPKLAAYDDLLDNEIAMFFSSTTDVFEGASQYASPDTVQNVCQEFTKNVSKADFDVLDALAGLLSTYYDSDGYKYTFDVNYTASVESALDTTYGDNTDYTDRLWFWQTCTEFGYFQSTDRGTNIFQATVPMNVFLDICKDVFGVDVADVKKSIDDTNAYYGQRDYYTGTNVVFAHGTVDPWSFLTKQMGTSKHWSVITAEIEGGTHTSDLKPACDADGKNCNLARQQVQTLTLQNIDQWLNGPFTAPDSIVITDNVGKRPAFYDAVLPAPLSVRQNGPQDSVANNRAKRAVATPNKKESEVARAARWFTGKSTHNLQPNSQEKSQFAAETNYIDQPWDHFNPNDDRQFQQRFFVNEAFAKKDKNGERAMDAPNFLMIGYEGPESDAWVTNETLPWINYAKEVGANLYVLEHRYYGASTLKTIDLQYLTSAQMLYDVARFISSINRSRSQTGPWITFGLSYAGSLAAWSREWFPELISGAVGSSAPMMGKTDFFEYLQVVENVMRAKSQKCADRTQDAFDQLRVLTHNAAGRKQISTKFNLVPAWSDKEDEVVPQVNIQAVFLNLYSNFQDIIQYSDANTVQGRTYTVTGLCAIMEDEKTYPNSLDAVRQVQIWMSGGANPTTNSDPNNGANLLKDMTKYVDGHVEADGKPKYPDHELAGVLWAWQTCNEFGYYQTTDMGESIFGNPVPLNFFVAACEQVFDGTMDHIEKGVARTNYQYGGRTRYSATNVVLPHGSNDPWHALGITEQGNLDPSVVPLLIDGTTHCADTFPTSAADSKQLVAARQTILANIKQWLAAPQPDAPTVKTTGPTTAPVTSSTIPTTTKTPSTPPTTTSAGHITTFAAVIAPLAALLVI